MFIYIKLFETVLLTFIFFTVSSLKTHAQVSLCRNAVLEYTTSVRKMTCDVLEMITDGLGIKPRNTLSKLVSDQNSDSKFRLNHYPPCPLIHENIDGACNNVIIGFGEHTDPQILSVLRSNNTSGFQINLTNGSWISVPSDPSSFFFNVCDSLQV